MNAILSGRSGRALILEGESLKSLEIDDPSQLVTRYRSDLPYLFGEAADLRIIENTTLESVERELRKDCNFAWALDLTLILLDTELPDEIRKDAIRNLEELFETNTTVTQVESVLYAEPLPEDADLKGALELCEVEPTSAVFAFLHKLEDLQQTITDISDAWKAIPTKTFGDHQARERFRYIAVKEALFHTLVTRDPATSIATFLLDAGLNKSVKQLPNHRQVLQAWISPFRGPRESPSPENEEEDTSSEERLGKRNRIDRQAVLREINKKKREIVKAMGRGDLVSVRRLVDELVAYQQANSEPQHIAKSLCDLAMEAKSLNLASLQLELTERSIGIAPGDKWSWAQHGDALLRMGRLDEALNAYVQAESYGAGVVAKTGRAEVLKAQGHFAAARAAFDEVIRLDPDNMLAKTGRAEVLKAQGQFAVALAAFDEVIRLDPGNMPAKIGRAEALKAQGQFAAALVAFDEAIRLRPDNMLAKTGRAEVLKAQGQFAAALIAFDEVIRLHPADVVAKNGRAEVLKAQGQFSDALAAFDEVIRLHPQDTVAKNGRAEVLKAQGNFAAALAAFDDAIRLHPKDPVAKVGRAETLKAQGQFADALAAFDEAIRLHPDNVFAKTGRAELLKAQGQFAAALTAFDEAIRLHPDNVVAKTGRAEVLKAQGQFAAALAAIDDVIRLHPESIVAKTGRAEVLKAQGRLADALAAFDEAIRLHPDNVVAKTGRAEVLKAQGRFAAALAAFDKAIKQHRDSSVARNGRTGVLVSLGRYKEALESLPQIEPVAISDWVAYHIRGMCLLRLGDTVRAARIFKHGLQTCPFFLQKEYFRSALALSWLHGKDFKKAGESLDSITSPLLQPAANVIQIHAYGAQGNRQRAVRAYEHLQATPHLRTDELTQELYHQYILQQTPTKDEEWIFEREIRIFLRSDAA